MSCATRAEPGFHHAASERGGPQHHDASAHCDPHVPRNRRRRHDVQRRLALEGHRYALRALQRAAHHPRRQQRDRGATARRVGEPRKRAQSLPRQRRRARTEAVPAHNGRGVPNDALAERPVRECVRAPSARARVRAPRSATAGPSREGSIATARANQWPPRPRTRSRPGAARPEPCPAAPARVRAAPQKESSTSKSCRSTGIASSPRTPRSACRSTSVLTRGGAAAPPGPSGLPPAAVAASVAASAAAAAAATCNCYSSCCCCSSFCTRPPVRLPVRWLAVLSTVPHTMAAAALRFDGAAVIGRAAPHCCSFRFGHHRAIISALAM